MFLVVVSVVRSRSCFVGLVGRPLVLVVGHSLPACLPPGWAAVGQRGVGPGGAAGGRPSVVRFPFFYVCMMVEPNQIPFEY